MKKPHPNAQDGVEQGLHAFGPPTTFRAAYPQVTALAVTVRALPAGLGAGETYEYSLSCAPGQFTPCPNPQCAGGGFNVGSFLADLVRKGETEGEATGGCVGREKMGRSSSRHCHSRFEAKATLAYAESP